MSQMSQVEINPIEAIRRIKEEQFDPTTLTPESRHAVIFYLRYVEGVAVAKIADILSVTVRTIYRDLKEIQATHEKAGRVAPLTPEQMVRDLRVRADVCYSRALRKGEGGTAFNIWSKFVEKLQSLGMLPRVAEKHEFGQLDKQRESEELRELREIEVGLDRVVDAEFTSSDAGANGQGESPEAGSLGQNGAEQ